MKRPNSVLISPNGNKKFNYNKFLDTYFHPYANMTYYDSMMLISLSTSNTGFIRFSGNTSSKLYFCYKNKDQQILQLLLLKTGDGGYIVDRKNFSNFVSVCRYIYQRFNSMQPPSLWKIILFKVGKIPLLRKHYDDILKNQAEKLEKIENVNKSENESKLNRLASNQSAMSSISAPGGTSTSNFLNSLVARNRERFRNSMSSQMAPHGHQMTTTSSEEDTFDSENQLLSEETTGEGSAFTSARNSFSVNHLKKRSPGRVEDDNDGDDENDEETDVETTKETRSGINRLTRLSSTTSHTTNRSSIIKSAVKKSYSASASSSINNLSTNNLSNKRFRKTLNENSETPLSATQLSLGSRSKSCRSVASLSLYKSKCVTFGKINVRYITN